MAVLGLLFLALLSVLLGASFLNLLPMQNWLLELNHNFGAYYLVLHVLMIPLGVLYAVYSERVNEIWVLLAINVLMVIYYAFPAVPLLKSVNLPEGDISCDRLYTALFVQAQNSSELIHASEIIAEQHPDLLFSVTAAALEAETTQLLSFYRSARRTKGSGATELAIAAQVPLSEPKITDLGEDLPGAIIVDLPGQRVPNAALALVAGVDPLSDQQLNKNNLIMRRSSAALRALSQPALIATSLRMTPHSRLYRVFKEDEVFYDLFTGKGLVRTWSGRSPLIRFHYDQFFGQGAFLSPGASTIKSDLFDHLPIKTEVRFCR